MHNYLALSQNAMHSQCCRVGFEDGLDNQARCRFQSCQAGNEDRCQKADKDSEEKQSPVGLVGRMDDDGGIALKRSKTDVDADSQATAAVSKPSSANKKRLCPQISNSQNQEMIDDYYSSTNSDSQANSENKIDEEGPMHKMKKQKLSDGIGHRQHIMMDDNVTSSDDFCDHIESSRCATKK